MEEYQEKCEAMMETLYMASILELRERKGDLPPAVLSVMVEEGYVHVMHLEHRSHEEKLYVYNKVKEELKKNKPSFAIHISSAWVKAYPAGHPDSYDHQTPVREREGHGECLIIVGVGDGFCMGWMKTYSRDEDGEVLIDAEPPKKATVSMDTLFGDVFEIPKGFGRA